MRDVDVLVADDDPDIRFVVEIVLRRRGWRVTSAESGAEAVAVLSGDQAFDALVLDQNMPPGSGLEVVEWLRGQGDRTPAVLFTGLVSVLDLAAAEARGVRVLDKVAVEQLPALLDELVGPDGPGGPPSP
ncbi:response regulator [Nocardioides sp. 1609]|uniref:response regulator n=1 Tax=Nocardioides sp. 1609 TaxID=2508327 RepID=UPI00142F714E|nr:response regulator [Nocardioides sp. 1609]